ncbi:hypothetical protein WR25_20342 [Diploscapter pachys]|uniref:Uncharacterized protein n=1 Tax=Diploscapter pachys TaxID=2018661 RepID=A0A2A2JNV3_9BILA|nr:hypothetical protein WR25_20342 [Diploscapter pachys]
MRKKLDSDDEFLNQVVKSFLYKDYGRVRVRRSNSEENMAKINSIVFDRSLTPEQQWQKWQQLPQDVKNEESLKFAIDEDFFDTLRRAYEGMDMGPFNELEPHVKDMFYRAYIGERMKNSAKYDNLPAGVSAIDRVKMAAQNVGVGPKEQGNWDHLMSAIDVWERYMSKLFSRENASTREPEPETEPPQTEAPTTEEATEPPPTSPEEAEETTTEEPSTENATQEPEKVVGFAGKTSSLLCLSFSIFFYSIMSRVLPF